MRQGRGNAVIGEADILVGGPWDVSLRKGT